MKNLYISKSLVENELETAKRNFDKSEHNNDQNYYLGRINAFQFLLEFGTEK